MTRSLSTSKATLDDVAAVDNRLSFDDDDVDIEVAADVEESDRIAGTTAGGGRTMGGTVKKNK